jgi:hypothetical protein
MSARVERTNSEDQTIALGEEIGHSLGRRIHRAEIDCLPEGEIVRMENAAPPIRKNPVAEYLEQGGLNIALEVVGFDADPHLHLQGDV